MSNSRWATAIVLLMASAIFMLGLALCGTASQLAR
jgi:hypothetical protein